MTAPLPDAVLVSRPEGETGPGHRLREARLAASLSMEDITARLHLDGATIRALESDDYAELPAPTFVRGYLRAYARLLNLPAGPIVEAFDRHGLDPPRLVPDIARKAQAKSSDFPVRLVTYGIVIGLGALVLVWARNQDLGLSLGPQQVAREPAVVSESPIASPVQDAPGKRSDAPVGDPGSKGLTIDPVVLPLPPSSVSDGLQESSVGPAAAGTAVVSIGPDVPDADAGSVDPPDEPAPVEADVASPAEAEDRLRITLSHDSWTEVYGQGTEQLFYGLAKAGQAIDLSDAGPYRVLLGYAPGAHVEYNGEPFDTAPFMRRGVARFTVGAPVEEGSETNTD